MRQVCVGTDMVRAQMRKRKLTLSWIFCSVDFPLSLPKKLFVLSMFCRQHSRTANIPSPRTGIPSRREEKEGDSRLAW